MGRLVSLVGLAVIFASAAAAEPTPSAEAVSPCSHEKSQQFDFWIGEWDVFAGDKLAGTNSIRPILDGCVLQESWSGAGGSAGSSFNFYDPQRGKWRQLWVWRNGTTLELEGGFDGERMVLSGESTSREGKKILNRITWRAHEDGTVRQHWQVSKDGGESWQTSFDGRYKRR